MVAVARQRPKGFPRGEAVTIGSSEPIVTDEGCRVEIQDYQSVSGLHQSELHAIPHPSSKSTVPVAFESTFPPGEGFAPLNDHLLYTQKTAPDFSSGAVGM